MTFVSTDVLQWNSVDAEIPLNPDGGAQRYEFQFWRIYAGVVGYYSLSAKQRTKTAVTESIASLSVRIFDWLYG